MTLRRALAGALLAVLGPILGSCSLLPCVEARHASGLLLVCPERYAEMPEALKGAVSFAWELAEDNADDLGYPWADPATQELEMRVTGPRGEAIAREWIANGARRAGPKPRDLPRPEVPVRFVTVGRSFRQLQDIQHGVVPATDLPDGDAIYATGPGRGRNVTVITIDRPSDRLLRALAARYGTEAVVIRVDPDRPRIGY